MTDFPSAATALPQATPGAPGRETPSAPTNRRLAAAAFLAALTAAVHLVAGGSDVATPLLASALAPTLKFTLYAVWHLVSLALALSAAALFVCARRNSAAARPLAAAVALFWLGAGLVFLAVILAHPQQDLLFRLPQWTLLLPVGILAAWGRAALPAGGGA